MAKETRQGAPADDAFRAWFDERVAHLRPKIESIVATGEPFLPVMFIFEELIGDTGRMAVFPVRMDGVEDKERVFAGLRLAAEQPFIAGAILLVESWVKTIDGPADRAQLDRYKSLADDPDRQEAIILNAMRHNMQLIAQLMIDRATNTVGDPMITDPMSGSEVMVGRMVYNKPTEH